MSKWLEAADMYSMPQQAVTKGYTKIEYFRAQPMTLSILDAIKPGPSPETISISHPAFCIALATAVAGRLFI